MFDSLYSATSNLEGCPCGAHDSLASHNAFAKLAAPPQPALAAPAVATHDIETSMADLAEAAVVKAIFGADANRRGFMNLVGSSTAAAAIASVLPMGFIREVAAQAPRALEKPKLEVGFIPITCSTPVIMAHPMGFYAKHGLDVNVVRTAGWAVIRDKSLNREYDAAHMLAPMPLAISVGAGSNAIPWAMGAIQNINGQAITLATKHRDKRDPKQWRGFRFAVPFDYSIHNYLLRYYVAEAGLDPDRDIQIRAVPPPEMVANLRADNIDGFLGPDPFNQRAVFDGVGFIHILTRELWDGHPCCVFATSREFTQTMPNTFQALMRAIVEAAAFASKAENRRQIAEAISPQNYLNQPQTVVEQVLTGTFADGLGQVQRVPERIGFDPFPWHSMAIWILTQMKRWGQIRGDVNYAQIAEQVFLAADAGRVMRDVGLTPPASPMRNHTIMGKTFDPANPEGYIASFPIRRT
ncbi:MAG: ABC transporter substrate-binding protein [Azospirillum sp.]|nr:ABC transporter substrate-binding protein [Azospirillum sp.]MCZ8125008.1 CmpA/NrtA family ABC transporter substrate-binding protein [Magnetospirillum sp.]